MNKGKVYLVGAGPGSLDLLTLKGFKVLSEADTVVYDSLVGDEVLSLIPASAKAVNAGKRSSHHNMEQEDISALLAAEAAEGKTVVRLKGGDPFVFGRGGEEIETLAARGIPFEIVPGVTSAFAVPAYAGIPVTHRDFCSSVHVITGHRKGDASAEIDYSSLVKAGGTYIFLMGLAALPDIVKGFTDAGLDEDTPAAVIEKGTTAGQKIAAAPLKDIVRAAADKEIKTPAVIVVGDVCALSEKFFWREKLPLFGRKIIVTRPKEQAAALSERLREFGAEVLSLPSIKVCPSCAEKGVSDEKAMRLSKEEAAESADRYMQDKGCRAKSPGECLGAISSYNWIAFTSSAGVKFFFDGLLEEGLDIRSLSGIQFAAIGPGTAGELKKHGIIADLVPDNYDGASLGAALACKMEENSRLLIPRSSMGGQEIIDALSVRRDIGIDDVPVYDTKYISQDIIDVQGLINNGDIDCVIFTSSSTVKGFAKAYEGFDPSMVNAVCIGRKTQDTAKHYGMKTLCAKKASIDSIMELILENFGKNK